MGILQVFKNMWVWHLGTWFSADPGGGGAGLLLGLREQFRECMGAFALVDGQQVICVVWLEHTGRVRVRSAACSKSLAVVRVLSRAGGRREAGLCPSCAPRPCLAAVLGIAAREGWGAPGDVLGGRVLLREKNCKFQTALFDFPPSPPSFDFYFHF